MSVCMLTVSKALDMSSATTMVLCGGAFWLKPFVMLLFRVCRAVVVECLALKPCWCVVCGMFAVMWGSIIFSRVLAIGVMSAMGLYEVPMLRSLPGLGIGMMLASFHVWGMVFVFRAVL